MDVRIHNVVKVTEKICDYDGGEFTTRTLRIVDKNGNNFSLTLFGANATDLVTQQVKHEEFEL